MTVTRGQNNGQISIPDLYNAWTSFIALAKRTVLVQRTMRIPEENLQT
jgi:hypothetical protein